MTWLVFGVSCLLVLAGAVSITFGAPIIQLERGWAEVIAGSVSVSGGGVVFALGVVLVRLEALRDAVAAASRSTGVPFAVRDVPLEALAALAEPEPVPASPAPAPATAPEAVVMPSQQDMETDSLPLDEDSRELANDQGLWKRIRRPTERAGSARDPILAAPELPTEPSSPEAVPTSRPISDRFIPEPQAPAVPSTPRSDVVMPRAEPAKPVEDEPGQLGWLERSLFRGRSSRAATEETSEASGRLARVEPSIGSLIGEPTPERTMMTEAMSSRPEPITHAYAEEHPAAPADEGPSVIGRYQAGVASYVMYSDGTIEVETEGGQSHRFGSMEELKAFIANQDKAET